MAGIDLLRNGGPCDISFSWIRWMSSKFKAKYTQLTSSTQSSIASKTTTTAASSYSSSYISYYTFSSTTTTESRKALVGLSGLNLSPLTKYLFSVLENLITIYLHQENFDKVQWIHNLRIFMVEDMVKVDFYNRYSDKEMEITQKVYEDYLHQHPMILLERVKLARFYAENNIEVEKAENIYTECYKHYLKLYGKSHPKSLELFNYIRLFYLERGQSDKLLNL
jgi:hypothetical protein